MKSKICQSKKFPERACGLEKPLDQFSKGRSLCKDCHRKYKKEYDSQYRQDHKEEKQDYMKEYNKEHKEEIKIYNVERYQNNKEEIKKNTKQYKLNNEEKLTEYHKKYYQDNKGEIKEYQKQYHEDNKEEITRKRNKRDKEKRDTDPAYRLRKYFSSHVRAGLKRARASKGNKSILRYLDYTFDEVWQYLLNHPEKEPWMNASNYGRGKKSLKDWNNNNSNTWWWEVDHIIPHSDFYYTSMENEEFKKCWDISNLRPLSAKQNHFDGITKIRHKKK